jgi:hypothetical protein
MLCAKFGTKNKMAVWNPMRRKFNLQFFFKITIKCQLATKEKQFASASRKTKIIIQISVNSKCTATCALKWTYAQHPGFILEGRGRGGVLISGGYKMLVPHSVGGVGYRILSVQ